MPDEEKFLHYIGEPDIERLVGAMRRQEVDRVPNVEVVIEDQIVEKMLGRYGGNTLAYGGDPAKGTVDERIFAVLKRKENLIDYFRGKTLEDIL